MPASVSPSLAKQRLRTVHATGPGITRLLRGNQFVYRDARGRAVRDADEVRRIRSLAVPPAWTDVWICADPNGHIQATGRDARGRKQYRYHPAWTTRREAGKTERLLGLAEALPGIRRRVRRDLARDGLPREKVLALMVRLLEMTAIRPGHREYTRQNGSYGLATLQDSHASIRRGSVAFRFNGKGGKRHSLAVEDERISHMVDQCRRLRGRALFQYLNAKGKPRPVHAGDLNRYLNEISRSGVTARDLRTWGATVAAYELLVRKSPAKTPAKTKALLTEAVCTVAEQLGNTPSICRTSYIHIAVQQAFLKGRLPSPPPQRLGGLSLPESAVHLLLRKKAPATVPRLRHSSCR